MGAVERGGRIVPRPRPRATPVAANKHLAAFVLPDTTSSPTTATSTAASRTHHRQRANHLARVYVDANVRTQRPLRAFQARPTRCHHFVSTNTSRGRSTSTRSGTNIASTAVLCSSASSLRSAKVEPPSPQSQALGGVTPC